MRWIVGSVVILVIAAIAFGVLAVRSGDDRRPAPISPSSAEVAELDDSSVHASSTTLAADVQPETSSPTRAPARSKSPRISSGAGTIRGRAVDEHGNPIELGSVRMCLEHFRPDARGTPVLAGDPIALAPKTEIGGRFRVDINGSSSVDASRQLTLLVAARARTFGPNQTMRGVVVVPDGLSGEFDTGDVMLVHAPFLLSGVVVDEHGQPVPLAHVYVSEETDERTRDETRFGPLPAATTDQQGQFELDGWTDEGVLSVNADGNGFENRFVNAVVPLSHNLRIVLARSHYATLSGRVIADGETLLSHVSFTSPSAEEYIQARALHGQVLPTNPKELPGKIFTLTVRPGDCTVEVYIDSGVLVERIEHIAVVEGQPCADPRLDPIDLRGKLQWVETKLQNRDGTPFHWSVMLEPASGTSTSMRPDKDGLVRVLGVVGTPWYVRPPIGERLEMTPGGTIVMPAN